MTKENIIALIAVVVSLVGYAVQDIRRQSAYETKIDALLIWQSEHQKTESTMAVTNQKVDALTVTVEKLAHNMERFIEEIYRMKVNQGAAHGKPERD